MIAENDKYKDLFIQEVEDQLLLISDTLLDIEKNPNNLEQFETLMRSAHTIKGAAATMGYTQMSTLAHTLEDLFHAAQRNVITLSVQAISIAFATIDYFRTALQRIRSNEPEADSAAQIATIRNHLNTTDHGEVASHVMPPLVQVPQALVTGIKLTTPNSVRVGVDRLDSLMGLFEELLMLRLKLESILEPALELVKTINDPHVKQKTYFLKEFRSLFNEFARLLSETQSELLTIRLVPLELIFAQFPRMIRDLALRQGKKIDFVTKGGEIELDRTVIEGLGGALAHLLRNAVDHGIGTDGKITLFAQRNQNRVQVIVEDTGNGIDYQRVKEVAVSRGVISVEEVNGYTNQKIAELLFRPNMSTNTEVTDVSGRGVGLSAVSVFAQDMGGHLSVISPLVDKKGTRFTLDLPISLATVNVLLVSAGGATYAIPFRDIVRTFEVTTTEIVSVAHQEIIMQEGTSIPVLRLGHILGASLNNFFQEEKINTHVLVVLIEVEGRRIALAVDGCLGEEELLIKSLPPILRDVRGFSGSALLPDGRTILLLDTHGLLEHAFSVILNPVSLG